MDLRDSNISCKPSSYFPISMRKAPYSSSKSCRWLDTLCKTLIGVMLPFFMSVPKSLPIYLKYLSVRQIGLALRMAISLGLHREISEPSLDIVAREHRRRLWWSVYSMDR